MDTLFDANDSCDTGPKNYLEPNFQYLNRSARPEFKEARRIIQTWVDRYPSQLKDDWRGRFTSDNNRHHYGAFFELYCHEFLLRQGYSVEGHCIGDASRSTAPDFLV